MNKQHLKIGLAALIAASFSSNLMAAFDSGTADANVITPLTVTEDVAVTLDFGDFSRGIGGTVTMDNDAASTRTAAGPDLVTTTGTPSRGKFDVTGQASQAITVTTDFTGAQLENAGGATMALAANGAQSVAFPAALTAGGIATVYVGGVLTVGAAQASGLYSTGTGGGVPYTVTVNYQ